MSPASKTSSLQSLVEDLDKVLIKRRRQQSNSIRRPQVNKWLCGRCC